MVRRASAVGLVKFLIGVLASVLLGMMQLDLLQGDHLGGAPVDLDDLADEAVAPRRIWIQSSTSNGRCAWMDRPAKRLPRVSWSERPTTAVRSARRGEDRARLHARGPQGDQHHRGVDERLEDLVQDAPQRAAQALPEEPVHHQDERGAPERREEDEEREARQRVRRGRRQIERQSDEQRDQVEPEERRREADIPPLRPRRSSASTARSAAATPRPSAPEDAKRTTVSESRDDSGMRGG